MNPNRWRYGSSGKRRRSWRSVSGRSSASRASRDAIARDDPVGGGRRRERLHQPGGDRLVAAQDVVGVDPQRLLGDLGGHLGVAVAVAADPAAPAQERPDARRPRPASARCRRPGPSRARRAGRAPRRAPGRAAGSTVNSVASKNAIAVRTSSSGVGRDDAQVRGPPQERDLLAQPAPDLAVLDGRQARVVESVEQDGAAAQRDERRPPAGLGRVRGQDRR